MEILALNPKPRKRGKKKGARKMASKKRSGSGSRGGRRSTKRVYHVVSNPIANPPGRARRAASAARRYAGVAAGSIGLVPALKNMLPMLAGVVATKLIQKKFGDGTAENKSWTWKDYLVGALGGFGAAFISRGLFKGSPQTSQKILEGSFLFLGSKILLEEIVPMSKTAEEWLGQEDDFAPAGLLGTGQDEAYMGQAYEVGDLLEADDGQTYVLGQDWRWRPADDGNRLLGEDDFAPAGQDEAYMGQDEAYMGESLAPVARFGDAISVPGRLGGFGAVPAAWVAERDRR